MKQVSFEKKSRRVTKAQLNALNTVIKLKPKSTKDSEAALRESLKENGQLSPILRYRGVVFDGHRRQRALKALKIKPRYLDLDISPELALRDEALGRAWLETNGCREELSVAVRAAMALELAKLEKGDNQHTKTDAMSQAEAGKSLNVSTDTMQRVDHIKRTDKSLFSRVLKGEVSIPQAIKKLEARELVKKAGECTREGDDIAEGIAKHINQGHRYSVIYADPAWPYDDADEPTYSGHPARHYKVMECEEIEALRVKEIAAKDSVCFMWTPNCLLPRALKVLEAWGFQYVTLASWAKPNAPQTRGFVSPYTETLLVGKRGGGVPAAGKMKGIYSAPRGRHSEKPKIFAEQIERLFPKKGLARIELFCREPRPGWDAHGNQKQSTNIRHKKEAKL